MVAPLVPWPVLLKAAWPGFRCGAVRGAIELTCLLQSATPTLTRRPPAHAPPPGQNHRRPADHLPEQAPREPTPRQLPPPELADNRPLPLAFEPPEATLTLTAPLLDTLPWTGIPPAPDTTPSWISTPKLELGSQAPRCVMICTVQLPS
jgi:hypothetical protein